MVGHDIGVIVELFSAERANATLRHDLSVHQLAHLGVGADLPISSGVLRIVNAADPHLARSSFLRDGFPSATGKGTVKWAQLISTESHGILRGRFSDLI